MEPERRRLPRFVLTSEQFRLEPPGKVFAVVNLSDDGMALGVLAETDLALFSVGAQVHGTLNLKGNKHSVQGRVRYIHQERVGVEFEGVEASAAIRAFLDPWRLGSELRPMPSSEADARWYHAVSGADLFAWDKGEGDYRKLLLFVHPYFVEWEEGSGVNTGVALPTDERSESAGALRLEALIMRRDVKPDVAKLDIAKKIILGCNLSEDLKSSCSRRLTQTSG